MTFVKPAALALALVLALPAAGQETKLDFEPRVGTTGTRVTIAAPVPAGATVRFAGRAVPILVEPGRRPSFLVPDGAESGFIEVLEGGRVVARSTVPFVVAGASIVNVPKLVGLKEAIDVFGYAEPMPEGGGRPESRVKPILSLAGGDVLTIGEAPPPAPLPWAVTHDAASAARSGMGPPGFLLTARPPTQRVILIPPPPPLPTPTPAPTPGPSGE